MDSLKQTKTLFIEFLVVLCIVDNVVGQVGGKLNNHLLLAHPGTILKVHPSSPNQRIDYASSISPISLDFDFKRNSLIWSDIKTNQIYSLADDTTDVKILVSNKHKWEPFSIAIDYVSDKLYVADTFTDTVQILDLNNLTNHGILIGSSLSKVKAIALDPYEGCLFILDQYQILKTNLDGSNSRVIYFELDQKTDDVDEVTITKKPINLANIALDLTVKRLYWINTKTQSIESSDYNGKSRITNYQHQDNARRQQSYTLTILNNNLYWLDVISKQVFKINLNKGKVTVVMKNVYSLIIKGVSYPNQQKIRNPCNINNGQCQHLCFLSKNSKEDLTCTCNIGYQLGEDGKSCRAAKDFLLIKQGKLLRGKSLNANGYIASDVINPAQFEVGFLLSLDVDAIDRLIFYSSIEPNDQIHQVRLETGEKKTLLPDILSNSVGKIAYDWVTRNLYYFTHYYSDMVTLSVVNVNNPTYSKILLEDVKGIIGGITIHPNRGYIYFILMDMNICSINRINNDGSGLQLLIQRVNSDLFESLAVDYNHDRIYFTESKKEQRYKQTIQIRHCNLDGEDIQDLLKIDRLDENIVTMAIFEHLIYINTGAVVYRFNKFNGELITLLKTKEMSPSLSYIKVFNNTIKTTAMDHPCKNNINHCQKFCFAILGSDQHLKRVCGCPYGEKLSYDAISCTDNSQEEPPFLPCPDIRYKCKKSKSIMQKS